MSLISVVAAARAKEQADRVQGSDLEPGPRGRPRKEQPAPRSTLGLKDHSSDGVLRMCSRPGCKRTVHAKGLCRCHYKRARTGVPLDRPIYKSRWAAETTCLAPQCERPADKRGLCSMHYQRKRDGVPLDLPYRVTRKPGIEAGVVRVKATLRLSRAARIAVVAEADARGECVAAVLRQVVEQWAEQRGNP